MEMEVKMLAEFTLIFGLSIGIIYLCHKVRIPPIVGLLITGVVAGPHGLGLVDAAHEVELLAEIGVVLLLFTIGLELSLGELVRLKKPVFIGGAAQVLLTILAGTGISLLFGATAGQAVFFGFLAALSSTAIVLKQLQQTAQVESPQGRISLSMLIFQDLIIVPMVLLTPFLAGQGGDLGSSLLLMAGKALAVLTVLWLASRFVVPLVLGQIVRTRSRELFLLTTLVLCLSIALMTSAVGLSLSLGAFLAGLIMSESEYSISALEGILPFRDVFTSLFFISVGMLLELQVFVQHLPLVLGLTLAVLVGKALLAGGAALLLRYPLRTSFIVGLMLCQVGEFSFVLAKAGRDGGLFSGPNYQIFLAASIVTMVATPFLMAAAPRIADALGGIRRLAALREHEAARPAHGPCVKGMNNHLIIVGFGLGGKNLARVAKAVGIDYVILEMNPDTVRSAGAQGEPIHYGDAGHAAVLEHLCVTTAKVMAVVISDPASVRRVTATARSLNPELRIIARTRFLSEIKPLKQLGADRVVSEEFETSIEIFTRVLADFLVPRAAIQSFVEQVRSEGYEMLRELNMPNAPFATLDKHFKGMEVSGVLLEPEAMLDGMSLESAGLRRTYGLTVVAVQRGEDLHANPDGSFVLMGGDVVYIFGEHGDLKDKTVLFNVRRRSWES